MKNSKQKNLPAVRFIVHTVSSRPDSFGNRSHWARITSTISGRSMLVCNVGGEENVRIEAQRALASIGAEDNYPAVINHTTEVPMRQWKGGLENSTAVYESQLTAELLLALEQPEV